MRDESLVGKLVKLEAPDYEHDFDLMAEWCRNSEFVRLTDDTVAVPLNPKKLREDMEKDAEEVYFFMIRTVAENKPIGFILLWGLNWHIRHSFVGIGVGEPAYWGKGYGSEAMQLMLRYAFSELNLHRVSLWVFEYNPRAIRCYEKCGFRLEGRERQAILREGRRWDVLCMGILHEEWDALQNPVRPEE